MYCFNILLLIQCLCQMCVRCLSMLLIFAVYVWHCKLNRSNSQLQRCRPLLDHCGHVARSACTAASPRARTLHCTAVRRSSLKRACAHSHWWCWTGAHSALAEPVINWDRLCCGSRVTLARVQTSASALITSASGREQRDDWPREARWLAERKRGRAFAWTEPLSVSERGCDWTGEAARDHLDDYYIKKD